MAVTENMSKLDYQSILQALWEIDAPPLGALWIWKMPRDAMGRPRLKSVARGRGRPMAALGVFHIHKAEGGGASIT